MATLTIRGLDDRLRDRLRVRAAQRGHSMEEEARIILRQALGGMTGPAFLAAMQESFGPERGVELDIPPRRSRRTAPDVGSPRRRKP